MPLLTSQTMMPRTMSPPPSIIIHWMLRGSSNAAIIRWAQGVAGGEGGFFAGGGSRKSVTGSGVSMPGAADAWDEAADCGELAPKVTAERHTGQMARPDANPSGARKTTPQLQRTSAGISHPLQRYGQVNRRFAVIGPRKRRVRRGVIRDSRYSSKIVLYVNCKRDCRHIWRSMLRVVQSLTARSSGLKP